MSVKKAVEKVKERTQGNSGDAGTLPEHYKKAGEKAETQDRPLIELQEQFIEALPGEDVIPGRGQDYIIRDPRNYVEVPVDPNTGEPLVDFRFGSDSIPGRREKNLSKGYVPAYVKDRKLVPPGTPGSRTVQVGGATLLVRRMDVAKKARRVMEDTLKEKLASYQRSEVAGRSGIEITEEKSRSQVVRSSSED